jgi:hypothetical protein
LHGLDHGPINVALGKIQSYLPPLKVVAEIEEELAEGTRTVKLLPIDITDALHSSNLEISEVYDRTHIQLEFRTPIIGQTSVFSVHETLRQRNLIQLHVSMMGTKGQFALGLKSDVFTEAMEEAPGRCAFKALCLWVCG